MTYPNVLRRLALVGGILAFVRLGVAQSPVQLSSSSLTFSAVASGPAAPMQAVTVTSLNSAAVDFALLIDSGTPGTPAPAWLSVTPVLATTPAQIRAAVDPTALSPGTYSARVQLTDRQGRPLSSPPIIIPVNLQVAASIPQFEVTPAEMIFSASVSGGNLQQGLLVRSLAGSIGPVSVSVESGYPWLSATVAACDAVCPVNVNVAISTLSPGAHTGLLRITSPAGAKPVDVPVSVFAADHGPFDQFSPSAVAFEAVQGSGLSDSRSVSLINNGDAPSTWLADVTDGAQWLSVSPASGVTAAGAATILTVTMNLANQGSSAYGGMIRISSQDPGAVTTYLPVVLKVNASGTPATPLLSSGGLVLTAQAGAPESVQQQLTLSAASSATINFQAYPQSSSWLSLVPLRGQTSSAPTPLTITAAALSQAQGFYSGLINFGFGVSSVRSLHVGFAVTATQGVRCQPQLSYLTETGIPDNFSVRTGSAMPLEVVLVDDCGTPISNGAVTARFSNGDPGLELLATGNGHYAQTWTPFNPSDSLPGASLSIAFQAFAPPLKAASIEVIGAVVKDAVPAIARGGVINSFISSPGLPVAPGAIVQMYGSALAPGIASGTVTNGLLSSVVSGVSVTVGGLAAPIAYSSAGQINLQIPAELPVNRQYQVIVNNNGVYSTPEPINTIAAQPVIGAAQDVKYRLINAQNPAHPGDIVTLYLTGMGATNPPVPTGMLAPGSTLAVTAIQPQVTIDGAPASVSFSGLTPGGVGLYQINVQVPANARAADLPVVVSQGGVASNTAILPVR